MKSKQNETLTRTIKVSCLPRFLPGDVNASHAKTASDLWARSFFFLLTFYQYYNRLAIEIHLESCTLIPAIACLIHSAPGLIPGFDPHYYATLRHCLFITLATGTISRPLIRLVPRPHQLPNKQLP